MRIPVIVRVVPIALGLLFVAVLGPPWAANADLADVRLVVATDKTAYEPKDPVVIRIAFVNDGVDAVTLHFRDSCTVTFSVLTATGRLVYDERPHTACLLVLTTIALGPGETKAYELRWTQIDDTGAQVPWPADYIVVASSGSDEKLTPAETTIRIRSALTMTMTLGSRTTEMMSFETATVRVRLIDDATGAGVTGARISAVSRAGGTFSEVVELGRGEYAFRWEAPFVRVQTYVSIVATAKAEGHEDARAGIVFLVDPNRTNPDDPTQLFLLLSGPRAVNAGASMHVRIYLFTMEGLAVSGASVVVRHFGPGNLTGVVDELNGLYTVLYIAPSDVTDPYAIRIDVTASKFGYAAATSRVGAFVIP